jgi:ATP-binding cassette subfamily C protein LapB
MNDTENYLSEIMNNVDKIVSRGQVPSELSILDNKKNKSSNMAYSFYRYMDNSLFIVNTIVLLMVVACIGAAVRLYVKGKFDHLSFVTFFTILLMFRDRVINTLSVLPEFIDTIGRSDILMDNFDELQKTYNKHESKSYNHRDLTFENLTLDNVCYEINDKKIFENMNLQIPTSGHSIIGITGPSGKGKSTMCKMFLKMYKCNQGTVLIDGVNIDEIDPLYIRSNIVYINQGAKLFDRKILENILYGCNDKDTCNSKYKLIMSYPKIQELFKGLDMENSDSGPSGEKLSGGQRQMVNLISGLINPCRILILDEPTNGLDKTLKLELLEIIQKFKDDKQSIIIITHDKDVYPIFDQHIEI